MSIDRGMDKEDVLHIYSGILLFSCQVMSDSCIKSKFFTTEPPGNSTMEYYSAIKKNEIMLFAATWMNLEMITLTEVSQTKTNTYDITYMQNLNYYTNELIFETETDSQTKRTDSWLPGVEGKGEQTGSLGLADAN